MYMLSIFMLFIYMILTFIYQKSYYNMHHLFMMMYMLISMYEMLLNDLIIEYNLFKLLLMNNKEIYITFIYDKMSILFIMLVYIIYMFVINYTNWYLKTDPFIVSFILYMNMFTLSMITLVQCSNFMFMFYNWEIIGMTSYLLINFWFNKLEANLNSMQAMLYNKMGDLTYILGLILLLNNFNYNYMYYLFLISMLTKSAQFIFIVWLTNAMQAPTPTSVLLHSCTMVVLGLFLIYSFNYYNNNMISILALMTMLMTGINALLENDIKKIMAFSTCSQLGYMFYMMMNIDLSLYHLILHGFFKSLLFMMSGFLIYLFYNQDISLIGLLSIYKSNIYLLLLITMLAQLSMPFMSSFYSKDLLIELNNSTYFHYNMLLLLGTFLTISYSLSLLINMSYKKNMITFHNNYLNIKYLYLLFMGMIPLGLILKNYFTMFMLNDLLYMSFMLKYITLFLMMLSFMFVYNLKLYNSLFYHFMMNNFYIEKMLSKFLMKLYNYNMMFNFNYLENFMYYSNTAYIFTNFNYIIYMINPMLLLLLMLWM